MYVFGETQAFFTLLQLSVSVTATEIKLGLASLLLFLTTSGGFSSVMKETSVWISGAPDVDSRFYSNLTFHFSWKEITSIKNITKIILYNITILNNGYPHIMIKSISY